MVYDVANGVHYLVQFVQTAESALRETLAYEKFEASEDLWGSSFCPSYMSSEASEDSNAYETLAYESYESYEDSELRWML